jgi:hypothetical protein
MREIRKSAAASIAMQVRMSSGRRRTLRHVRTAPFRYLFVRAPSGSCRSPAGLEEAGVSRHSVTEPQA